MWQVDFANQYIGGGVLSKGRVQVNLSFNCSVIFYKHYFISKE